MFEVSFESCPLFKRRACFDPSAAAAAAADAAAADAAAASDLTQLWRSTTMYFTTDRSSRNKYRLLCFYPTVQLTTLGAVIP